MIFSKTAVADKEYFESGRWKCAKSPTGRHDWLIEHTVDRLIGTCKYCSRKKLYKEVTYGEWVVEYL